jgi:hypothetical protein
MFAARNQMSSVSRWRRDHFQYAVELTREQYWPVKIPAAVAGLAALCLLTAALWSPFSNATGGCRTSPLVFRPGVAAETLMTVARDRACSLYVSPGSAIINSLQIDAVPSGGTLSARGRTGVIYRALSGFNGDDAFTFTLAGKVKEDIATMTVKVQISVK